MLNRFHLIVRQDRHRRIGGAHRASRQLAEAGCLPALSLLGARAALWTGHGELLRWRPGKQEYRD